MVFQVHGLFQLPLPYDRSATTRRTREPMGRREHRVHLFGTYNMEAHTHRGTIQEDDLRSWFWVVRQPHSINRADGS